MTAQRHTGMAKAVTKPKTATTKAATRGAKKISKHVYVCGKGKADANRTMNDTLGGKGSGRADMTNAGLPVPPGFTISTDACNLYYAQKGQLTPAIEQEILDHVKKLEKAAGAQLGSVTNPLLVSVRSGAKFSMP